MNEVTSPFLFPHQNERITEKLKLSFLGLRVGHENQRSKFRDKNIFFTFKLPLGADKTLTRARFGLRSFNLTLNDVFELMRAGIS